jgi:hypothetical protein
MTIEQIDARIATKEAEIAELRARRTATVEHAAAQKARDEQRAARLEAQRSKVMADRRPLDEWIRRLPNGSPRLAVTLDTCRGFCVAAGVKLAAVREAAAAAGVPVVE